MNQFQARELFEYIKTGKIYFDHASVGPFSNLLVEEMHRYAVQRSQTDVNNWPGAGKIIEKTRNRLGELFSVPASGIAFTGNVSESINILASGLRWEKGNRILLNSLEFPANVYPFLNLAEKGVAVDFVKSENGIVSAEMLIENVKPNTKLISVSQVQFLTGYRIDLEKLGGFCKDNRIILSVDVIQGAGAFPLNAPELNIDFLAGGSHKWLMGPQGLGYFYVSERLMAEMKPSAVGWTSVKDPWSLLNYNLELRDDAARFEPGTLNVLGIHLLEKALSLIFKIGYENIQGYIADNTDYMMKLLEANSIPYFLWDTGSEFRSGIITIKTKNPQECFSFLESNNIKATVREGYLRFSPHFYNTIEELEKVTEVLTHIISLP